MSKTNQQFRDKPWSALALTSQHGLIALYPVTIDKFGYYLANIMRGLPSLVNGAGLKSARLRKSLEVSYNPVP